MIYVIIKLIASSPINDELINLNGRSQTMGVNCVIQKNQFYNPIFINLNVNNREQD